MGVSGPGEGSKDLLFQIPTGGNVSIWTRFEAVRARGEGSKDLLSLLLLRVKGFDLNKGWEYNYKPKRKELQTRRELSI